MKKAKESEFKKKQDQTADAYAKFVVFVWIIYGIYALLSHQIEGNWITLLIFIGAYTSLGIAIVGVSSIIVYTPIRLLNEAFHKTNNAVLAIITILVNQLLAWIIFALWAIFLANIVIDLNNALF